jgi:acetyltransferase-like isoleucine patch superfamily enzyme
VIPTLARITRRMCLRYVHRGATVRGKVELGRRSCVLANAQLIANDGGEIIIGDDCTIMSGVIIAAYGGRIRIGNRVGINPYSVLYGHGGLDIGDNTLIASHTVIIPANHNFSLATVPIQDQGLSASGIVIGSNVWLGSGVRILDGVTIEDGAIVGAGAVVTQSLQSNCIYAGVPARLVRSRFIEPTRG